MFLSALTEKTVIFIDGASGTTGLSLRKRLESDICRRHFELLALPEKYRKDVSARQDMMAKADITVLCLPDDAAREAVLLAGDTKTRLLDASSAHRISAGWVYGFPELQKGQDKAIAYADKVSNPGCYATGAIAILRPLTEAGLIPENYPISLHGISGYSGGGNSMISAWEKGKATAFEFYALDQMHKHLPEILKYAVLSRKPLFTPSVGCFRQGMIVFCPWELSLLNQKPSAETLREIFSRYYACFDHGQGTGITVLDGNPEKRLSPEVMAGRDDLAIRLHGAQSNRLVISAHFDNLGKGAAGAALRNLCLMHYGRLGLM